MSDIARQGAAVVARARKQADAMLAAAQVAAEELKLLAREEGLIEGKQIGFANGKEQGRTAGREEALAESREQLTGIVKVLSEAAQEMDSRRHAFEAGVLKEVVDLALKIASRVSKQQGRMDPLVLEKNLGASLKLVIGMHKLRIVIHPSQMRILCEALPRLKLEFPTLEHVEMVEDDSIAPGGCRLLTRQGVIDATLDEQLNRIGSELFPGA